MKFALLRFSITVLFFAFITSKANAQLIADFTVSDADGCSPLLTSFSDATTGGTPTNYSWDFGDGGISSIANPQHNYSLPGTYTVTLIVSNATSTDTIVKTNFITVFQNPVASYTVSQDTACSGNPITFTDASTPGDGVVNQWDWTFNDGNPTVSGVSTLNHTFINTTSQLNIFVPVLLVTDANGCNSIFSNDSVFIYPQPTASFGISAGSSCTVPATVTFTNNSTGPAIYQWNFGDPSSGVNNTSTLATPSHTYTTGGSYLVTLTNGVSNCFAQDTMTVSLVQPVASFSLADSIVCLTDSAFFVNSSTPSSATYQWTFGDGSPSSFVTNPAHRYLTPGIYTVTLTARVGACSNSTTRTVYVPPPPSVSFSSPDRISCNTPFAVTFNADTTSQNIAWQWTFGDPASGTLDSSSVRNPVHTYNNFGNYNVSLTVTDIFGCQRSTTANSYVQITPPLVDFTVSDSGCVNDIFTFNAVVNSPADTSIVNYSWDFGDGPPQTTTVPGITHAYTAPGIYDVSLTITTQEGCTATKTNQAFIRVGTKPDAQIDSVFHSICFKDNVSFNDLTLPPVTSWLWYFGDGGSSTMQNPSHQYNIDTSGVNPFDIILIAYYNGCADTDTVVQMVEVLSPIPNFDVVYNCTNQDSVKFTNLTGGGTSFTWDFGDGTPTDNSFEPSHFYAGPGVYQVKLTATNAATACTVDTTLQVTITNINAVLQRDTASVCKPGTIQFTGSNSPDASQYTWYFGEGIPFVRDTSFAADTIHLYTRPGFYTVKLITTDIHSCTDTDSILVHVLGPTAGFTTTPTSGCAPLNVTFTDTSLTEGSPVVQWVWNFGNGSPLVTTTTGSTPFSYPLPGSFNVTLTVTDANGCSDTRVALNNVRPTAPTANIFLPDTFGCRNTPEVINGSAGPTGSFATPVTYSWNFGDGQTFSDTVNQAVHSYSANGTYPIQLTVTDANGCTSSTTKNIFVYTTSAHFSVATTDNCVDSNGIKKAFIRGLYTSDSTAFVNNANYNWNLGVFSQSTWPNPVFQYDYNVPAGTYDASLILTNDFGCKDTFTVVGAVVVPGPTGSFSFSPDSGCTPLTVNFSGVSTNATLFAWDFGDGTVINGTPDLNVTHVYLTPNVYHPQFYLGFQLTNSFCYIPAPRTDSVIATSLINVDILEDTLYINEGEYDTLTVNVTNGNPPFTYVWNPSGFVANGPTSNTFLATTEQDSIYYTVTVPYGSTGCAGSDRVLIRLIPDICEVKWDSIPNVFTPNGDGKNDFFYFKDLCKFDAFFIKIFNRWGRLIYESTDHAFRWDGKTTDGTDVSEGVYYYIMHAKTRDLHGYIELIGDKN